MAFESLFSKSFIGVSQIRFGTSYLFCGSCRAECKTCCDEAMDKRESSLDANMETSKAPRKDKDPEHPSFWEFRVKPNPDYVGTADKVCTW